MLVRQNSMQWSHLSIFTDSRKLDDLRLSASHASLVSLFACHPSISHDWEENVSGQSVIVETTYAITDCNFCMAMASYSSSKISPFYFHLWYKPYFSLPSYGKYEKTRHGNTRPNQHGLKRLTKTQILSNIFKKFLTYKENDIIPIFFFGPWKSLERFRSCCDASPTQVIPSNTFLGCPNSLVHGGAHKTAKDP